MPYLPLDLDAKKLLEGIERGLYLPRHTMVGGAMEMWEAVWRQWMSGKPIGVAELVDNITLWAAFGPQAEIVPALVSRGFLELTEDGKYRVLGAEKWLFGLEGKSRGGKKAASNLKRGHQPGKRGAKKTVSPGKPGPEPEDTSRLDHRLLHPAPSTQHPAPLTTSPPPEADGGWKELVAALYEKFKAIHGHEPEPTGKDWAALKRLRGRTKLGDGEIVIRFARGLVSQFKQRVDSFADLDAKWDSLASADPPSRARMSPNAKATQADRVDADYSPPLTADGELDLMGVGS